MFAYKNNQTKTIIDDNTVSQVVIHYIDSCQIAVDIYGNTTELL